MKDFSWPTTSFNVEEFAAFEDKYKEFKSHIKGKRIYIYGAGIRGCMFAEFCERMGIDITGFYDGDKNKWGGTIKNKYSIFQYKITDRNEYIIISTEMYKEIADMLKSAGLNYGLDFFYVESVIYDKFIEKFFSKTDSKYMFMGDCIFSTVGMDDSCKDSLEDLLEYKFNGDIDFLAIHGMPLRTFYHLLRLKIIMDQIPRRLFVVVNTVMFSGKKNMLPRAQHTPLLERIDGMLGFRDKDFQDYVELTRERSNRYNTDSFVNDLNSAKKRNSEAIVRIRMRQNYMYKLDLNSEGILYLGEICKLCNKNNIEFIGFLPPINYEHGIELFGEKFKESCDSTLTLLKEYIEQFGYACCDTSYLLTSSEFASSDTINEITNYEGRIKEVDYIYNWLNKERT